VFAAARWAIGVVNEYVVVAGGADDTVNRLAELLVAHLGCVLPAHLLPAHGHRPPLRECPEISNQIAVGGPGPTRPENPSLGSSLNLGMERADSGDHS
jgi:hypothetical protein